MFVIALDGTAINLVMNTRGGGDNFTGTVFTDAAVTNIQTVTPVDVPFTVSYKPNKPLGDINNYHTGVGEWKLVIRDDVPGNSGSVINLKLNFAANVSGVTDTFDSNIPIIYLNTYLEVPRIDSVIKVHVKVIDHEGNARNKASDSVFQFFG